MALKKMNNQNILLGMICILFVLASAASAGRATSDESGFKHCFTPAFWNCPDNAECNKACLNFPPFLGGIPFPGGGSCEGNQCCCRP